MEDPTPPYVVQIDDLAEVEGAYAPPFDAEKLSFYHDIGRAAGSKGVGVSWERLLPGRRTSFTHAHSEEEELVVVLAGKCHVRILDGDQPPREVPLRTGHAVSFPAGTRIAHTFVNRGQEECTLLIVGERKPDTDRCFYPEDPDFDAQLKANRPARHWAPEASSQQATRPRSSDPAAGGSDEG